MLKYLFFRVDKRIGLIFFSIINPHVTVAVALFSACGGGGCGGGGCGGGGGGCGGGG